MKPISLRLSPRLRGELRTLELERADREKEARARELRTQRARSLRATSEKILARAEAYNLQKKLAEEAGRAALLALRTVVDRWEKIHPGLIEPGELRRFEDLLRRLAGESS